MDKGMENASGTTGIGALHSAAFQADVSRVDPCMKLGTTVGTVDSPRRILVLKARSGIAEKSGAPAFSGEDGEATGKALGALGYREDEIAWLYLGECGSIDGASLRMAVETVDPESILALDDESLAALCDSLGAGEPVAGVLSWVQGRRIVGVGGFEEMLASPRDKQLAWTRMKLISPEGPVY